MPRSQEDRQNESRDRQFRSAVMKDKIGKATYHRMKKSNHGESKTDKTEVLQPNPIHYDRAKGVMATPLTVRLINDIPLYRRLYNGRHERYILDPEHPIPAGHSSHCQPCRLVQMHITRLD